jgi:hypothetical protein
MQTDFFFLDRWDKVCLKPGVSWEDGFCDGIVLSRTFVPLYSRGACNNPNDLRCNWNELTPDSAADNVLLEHRLAQELRDRGLLESIHPIFIGDCTGDTYSNYFDSNCHPVIPAGVCVASLEKPLRSHLNRMCLGPPLVNSLSVAELEQQFMPECDPVLVQGEAATAFDAAVEAFLRLSFSLVAK